MGWLPSPCWQEPELQALKGKGAETSIHSHPNRPESGSQVSPHVATVLKSEPSRQPVFTCSFYLLCMSRHEGQNALLLPPAVLTEFGLVPVGGRCSSCCWEKPLEGLGAKARPCSPLPRRGPEFSGCSSDERRLSSAGTQRQCCCARRVALGGTEREAHSKCQLNARAGRARNAWTLDLFALWRWFSCSCFLLRFK